MIWLRRAMPYLGILIVLGLIYDGFIFYSRWSRKQDEREAQANQATEQERKTVEAYGGLDLKILTFYAAPEVIGRGTHTNLCYGVTGAKNVRMDPPVDAVWPALTRCVQVSPRKDTEYKLTAEDDAGHSITQSVTVKVGR
jgi:hypothetical protein